jgi:hypothetical protein
MFRKPEVTDDGYDLLSKTGLDKKVENNWAKIRDLIPLHHSAEAYELTELLDNKELPAARRTNIERWLKEYSDYDRTAEGLFTVSGTVTDNILSKEEILNPEKFGVSNLGELDTLLAAYALTRDRDKPLLRDYYTWRSPGLKTRIYGDNNGDLCVHQIDTKTRAFGLFGKLPEGGIHPGYGSWPTLVALALKYADTVGVEIPEVKNWQEFMKQYGWAGEIRDPGLNGIGYEGFAQDYPEEIIAQLPDKIDNKAMKKRFFGSMRPHTAPDILYHPIINAEQQLMICTSYTNSKMEDAEIKIVMHGEEMPFKKTIVIPKEDAGHLFKGAVHGIMTNQSRTIPHFLAYMMWEYDQLKAGKSADEISKEGSKRYRGW